MKSKHKFWDHEYVIAVTKGNHTRYFYGARLKDALAAAGKALPDGHPFSYAKFTKQSVTVAEKRGKSIVSFS